MAQRRPVRARSPQEDPRPPPATLDDPSSGGGLTSSLSASGAGAVALIALFVLLGCLIVAAFVMSVIAIARDTDPPTNFLSYQHTITLDLERFYSIDSNPSGFFGERVPFEAPFNVTLDIMVSNYVEVTIRLRNLNLDCSIAGVGLVPCFAYTNGSALPPEIWPVDVVPQAFFVGSYFGSLTLYQVSVLPSGSISIAQKDGVAIEATNGTHSLASATISYMLPIAPSGPPPANVRLSPNPSTMLGTPYAAPPFDYDFLDYFFNAIATDEANQTRVAFYWGGNGGASEALPRSLSPYVRTGIVTSENGPGLAANVNWNPAVRLVHAVPQEYYSEGGVAVSSIDSDHVSAVFTAENLNISPSTAPGYRRIVVMSSSDGGLTWGPQVNLTNSTQKGFDPWIEFDSFGNLWVSVCATTAGGAGAYLFLSTNGGASFSLAETLLSSDPSHAIIDFLKISAGPDGTGGSGQALWLVYDDYNMVTGISLEYAGYMLVSALGSHGSPTIATGFSAIPLSISGATTAKDGHVLVASDDGRVFMTQTDNSRPGSNYLGDGASLFLYEAAAGASEPLAADTFSDPRVAIEASNTAGEATTVGKPMPWQPNRGIYSAGDRTMGYDALRRRLYVLGWDERPNLSRDNAVYVIWTTDGGVSFSDPFPVNDYPYGSRGMCSLAVSRYGIVSVGCLDPRNAMSAQSAVVGAQGAVDMYAAVFSAPAA